ncbi:MAG TPA: hypothetical protein VHD63_28085 [Ktedonobacteraceae bacterium]|nr:hypothetical protein [Ktedonobacteraceae bacterium]
MNMHRPHTLQRLEKALILFFGILLLTLLVIFALEPSIYTSFLGLTTNTTERYPLPILLFLGALVLFLSLITYGIIHHWRWLYWPLLLACAGSVFQVPLDMLQLAGVFPNPYPAWYSLLRAAVGLIEIGFAIWMFRLYRHRGVWGRGKPRQEHP